MEKETLYEQMEHYLSNQMNESDRTAFENRLNNEPELQEELKLHRQLHKALSNSAETRLENTLKHIGREFQGATTGEAKRIPFLRKYAAAIAAGFAFLLLSIFFILQNSGPKESTDDLLAEFNVAYQFATTVRSDSNLSPRDSIAKAAFDFYQNKDYPKAIQSINSVIADSSQTKYLFMLGNAYQQEDQFSEAIQCYKRLLQMESTYKDQAEWNLALAYLQSGSADKGQQLIESWIEEDKDSNQAEAERLLKSLKRK